MSTRGDKGSNLAKLVLGGTNTGQTQVQPHALIVFEMSTPTLNLELGCRSKYKLVRRGSNYHVRIHLLIISQMSNQTRNFHAKLVNTWAWTCHPSTTNQIVAHSRPRRGLRTHVHVAIRPTHDQVWPYIFYGEIQVGPLIRQACTRNEQLKPLYPSDPTDHIWS